MAADGDEDLLKDAQNFNIISIIISALNFIVPSSTVNRLICRIAESDDDYEKRLSYDQARLNFTMDYDRCNPLTATKAMQEWVDFVEKKGDENQKKKNQILE